MEIELDTSGYCLRSALLVYESTGHTRAAIVTSHPVVAGEIQPGKPVDLARFISSLKGEAPKSSVLWAKPEQVASGPGWVCWQRAARLTTVFIGGKKRTVWVPDLIFVGGKKRHVWAVARSGHRTPSTKLYLTGWPNTYDDGGICWGTSKTPATLDIAAWEDAFFASSFSGETNLTSKKPYAVTKLKPYRKTLGQALASLPDDED